MTSNRTFAALALASTLGLLTGCTDAGRCELGSVGCYCDGTSCDIGGRCVSGMCETCPMGAANCACGPGDTCTTGLACNSGVCVTCPAGTEECPCNGSGGCDAGLLCNSVEDRCIASSDAICEDSCYYDWNGDGSCDDGGDGADYSVCNLGSDCTDCGARRNPCTDPDYPVFCTATPGFPSECWQDGVDCGSIAYCGISPDAHGCFDGYRYDCDTSMYVVNQCTDPAYPVFCEYDPTCEGAGTDCCFGPTADCRTATNCFGDWYVCTGRLEGEALDLNCGASVSEIACDLPP